MDSRYFELFLRRTDFSQALLAELWDGLTTKERVEVLLNRTLTTLQPPELAMKAATDPNPVVRMLAVRFIDAAGSELYAALKSDPSPLVLAAVACEKFDGFWPDLDDLLPLSQIERLGVIALGDGIRCSEFAKFIVNSLQTQVLSELEAAQLLREFIRNPHTAGMVGTRACDGMHSADIQADFEAIWNLTTCTPSWVGRFIANEFPLQTGDGTVIPGEMFARMNAEVIETLVWRRYKPLLDQIEKTPEQFDESVHNAVKSVEEISQYPPHTEEEIRARFWSELQDVREDITVLRTEMRELFEAVKKKIDDALSR